MYQYRILTEDQVYELQDLINDAMDKMFTLVDGLRERENLVIANMQDVIDKSLSDDIVFILEKHPDDRTELEENKFEEFRDEIIAVTSDIRQFFFEYNNYLAPDGVSSALTWWQDEASWRASGVWGDVPLDNNFRNLFNQVVEIQNEVILDNYKGDAYFIFDKISELTESEVPISGRYFNRTDIGDV